MKSFARGLGLGLLFVASVVYAANVYNYIQFGGDLAGSTWNSQTIANGAIDLSGAKVTGQLPLSSGVSGQLALGSQVSGQLPETNGGTNQTSYTQGDIIYASASNTLSKLAKSATATRYLANTGTSNNPAWAQVNVANGVTGSLPFANMAKNPVRTITAAGAVTVATTDYHICLNKTSGAATTVNLQSSPTTGFEITVDDCKGDAATNNITVTPAAGNIDGAGTFVINTNYGSWTGYYTGALWKTTASR